MEYDSDNEADLYHESTDDSDNRFSDEEEEAYDEVKYFMDDIKIFDGFTDSDSDENESIYDLILDDDVFDDDDFGGGADDGPGIAWAVGGAVGGVVAGGAVGGVVAGGAVGGIVGGAVAGAVIGALAGPRGYCRHIFYIPVDDLRLVEFARAHFNEPTDFSPNGIQCPKSGCTSDPFPNSEILLLHVLVVHRYINYVCGICSEACKSYSLFKVHFEDYHRDKNSLERDEWKIDLTYNLFLKLRDNVTQLVGTPRSCRHNVNVGLYMVCDFPETSKYITTEIESQIMLKKCFEGQHCNSQQIVRSTNSNMKCEQRDINGICGRIFETCRELVLHLTTHFGVRSLCIICFETYHTVEEAANHMAEIHYECTTCDENMHRFEIQTHRNRAHAALAPYIQSPQDINLDCRYFLPNIAFHTNTTTRFDYFDGEEDYLHCFQILSNYKAIFSHRNPRISVKKNLLHCIMFQEVVETDGPVECSYSNCNFVYNDCRELLIHILFKHSKVPVVQYYCSMCQEMCIDRDGLLYHIKHCHSGVFCNTCLWTYDTNLDLAIHQHRMGHSL